MERSSRWGKSDGKGNSSQDDVHSAVAKAMVRTCGATTENSSDKARYCSRCSSLNVFFWGLGADGSGSEGVRGGEGVI